MRLCVKRPSRKVIWTTVAALYILFIFSNSLKPADLSSADSGWVLELVQRILTAAGLKPELVSEHFIRKSAHFSEYSLLGLLLVLCFRSYGMEGRRALPIHALAGLAIPFLDETIQLFVEGRSGQISDVWLDGSGVAFGTLLYWLGGMAISRWRKRKGGSKG